jgi:nicotinamidase-related amidase
MKIPSEKTAIVLIEPQNDFLTPGGTMYQFIAEQLAKRDVINNLVRWFPYELVRGIIGSFSI